jgi:surface antigen
MVMNKMVVVVVAAGVLAGCNTTGQKASLGTLGGAVAGAAIGQAFGGGTGRIAATAAGALIGGFIGNQIGARMDEQDRQYFAAAQYQALETGQAQRWSNPQSGVYGDSTTGPVVTVNNAQCREFTNTIYIGGSPETARGTACRNPDGTWTPIS